MSLRQLRRLPALVILGLACVAASGQSQNLSSSDHAAIADFNRQVSAYVELHRRLEGPVPTVEVSADPMEVRHAMAALARKIRSERSHAHQGDLFKPAVAAAFRRQLLAGCAGDLEGLYAIANEENVDLKKWRPRVNASYPDGLPFSMMLPQVLCALPELPEELQFRFWDRDLILWDCHANLIVDVLPNAIPST